MIQTATDRFEILKDKRKLGYQILGDPNGQSMFFFHGTPGSRLALSDDDLLAKISGLRLILPDRPGYGISDVKPDRSICDWTDDVRELADSLNVETFAVSGGSGGGPYALACGARLGTRISKILLFNSAAPIDFAGATNGMAPGNKVGVWLTRHAPWSMRLLISTNGRAIRKSPLAAIASLAKQLPAPDRKLLEEDEYAQAVARDMVEAYRNGFEGHLQDARLAYAKAGWGFSFDQVAAPVFLWHGEQDTLSPINAIKRMAQELPNCQATYLPDVGHLLIDHPVVIDQVTQLFC